MALDLAQAQQAATVMLNFALAVAVGAGATAFWTTRRGSTWAAVQGRRARWTSLAAIALAMLASVCGLWLEAAAMAEVPVAQAGAAAWSMLTATHLGEAWTIGLCALVLGMAAMALNAPGWRARRLVPINLLALAAFLYTRSMVSHASSDGDLSVLMVADWSHLMLICLWTGEVLVAGFLTLAAPAAERVEERNDCAHYIESLSTSATFALAGVVATGSFSAWHNLGSANALIGNPYGTTLLVKLALVALAVMLGGVNRFFVMPSLIAALRGQTATANFAFQRFTLILRVEAGLLLGVLILAAILSSTSPPIAG
jgi:putative copper resistance protein D